MSPVSSETWNEVNLQGSPASVLRELKTKVWDPDRGSNGILICESDSLRITSTFPVHQKDAHLRISFHKEDEKSMIPGIYINNEYNPNEAYFIPEPVLARVKGDEQALFLRIYIFVVDNEGQVLQVKMIERPMQRTEVLAAWKQLKLISKNPDQADRKLQELLHANDGHMKVYTGEDQLNNAFTQFRKDFNLGEEVENESV